MDNTFFAFVALVIFLAVAWWFEAHKTVAKGLDNRSAKIDAELSQARQLRLDAEKLLADYKQKAIDAEKEAADIIASAKSQAEEYAADAAKKLSETITRRTKQAETKIALAQANAVKEVRGHATDLAVAAAGNLIAAQKGNPKLIAESIAVVKSKAN